MTRAKVQKALEAGGRVQVAMLDIDSTLTGDPPTADRVREILEQRGYLVVFNTSRTEEMVMTRSAYEKSRARGCFHRPPPHLGRDDGRRVDIPPEEVEPAGLLDPDIVAGSTGSRILVRQDDGSFLPDASYEESETLSPAAWRQAVFALLSEINGSGPVAEPADIEYAENYERGVSDVYPPDYRVQLSFSRPDERLTLIDRLRAIRQSGSGTLHDLAHAVHVLDDSEPRDDRYKAFVVPRWASKARAAHHIICRLRRNLMPERGTVEVLFVGDSYPDLHMGLLGGLNAESTLLLVGHSRLTDVLWQAEVTEFAGESLRAVKRRLRHADGPGYLWYRAPYGEKVQIIIGDVAFPGSAAVDTVERYLTSATG